MNRTLQLLRYAKLDSGWRRGAAVVLRNGKIKHPYMTVNATPVDAPHGRYQLVRYEGKRPIYTDLGNDPTEALARFRAEQGKRNARLEAIAAGWELKDESQSAKPAPTKTLSQYAVDFVNMHRCLPHRSDDSVGVYGRITKTFCEQSGARYPEQVTQESVIRWYGWLRDKGYSDRTRSGLYQSLRGFLRYCGLDPAKIIEKHVHRQLLKYTKKIPNSYTPEQVQGLVGAALYENEALLWDFAYKTGLRDSELQHVTRFDLHALTTPNPVLHVKERDELGTIKDAEERTIELHPSLVAPIGKWLEDHPKRKLLFGTETDKTDTKMLRKLKRTAHRAGLNCGHCVGCTRNNECRDFTLHRFRRTYVSRMLIATSGDLRSVMLRSGHSDLDSVLRYLAPTASVRTALATAF